VFSRSAQGRRYSLQSLHIHITPYEYNSRNTPHCEQRFGGFMFSLINHYWNHVSNKRGAGVTGKPLDYKRCCGSRANWQKGLRQCSRKRGKSTQYFWNNNLKPVLVQSQFLRCSALILSPSCTCMGCEISRYISHHHRLKSLSCSLNVSVPARKCVDSMYAK